MRIIELILGMGPTVMLPVVIFLLAMILGEKPGKSFRAGVTIGVGFIGIGLVIGLLMDSLGPAAQAIVVRTGIELDVLDVGWPAAAAIAFGSRVGAVIIPIGLAVNFLMLLTKTTKTVNVDIWNFWHFAFTGALVAMATGSFAIGVIAAAVNTAIVLKLADWTAPIIQKFYDIPGISMPHGFSVAYVPIAIPLNTLIDKIPVINKIEADPEAITKKFGILGEPIIVGLFLGIILGLLAGYDLTGILNLGMSMAGVMLLLPRVVKILMEGLIVVSEAARSFFQKRFAGQEFYIGLDSAIAIGHPTAIASALILVPITILLAVILPGNRLLPFGDLATIPFMVVLIAPITRGNVFRTVLIGTVVIGVGLLIATNVAPLHTQAAIEAAFEFPEGAVLISSICSGANPLTWILLQISKIFG